MKRADMIAAAICAALGAFVFVETAGYPGSLVPGAPGPAFFPRLLGGLLVACAAVLLVQGLRGDESVEERPSGFPWRRLIRPSLVLALVAVFLLLVERGDFILMTVPLLAAVMAVMGERRLRTLVLAPTLFAVFVYLVFFRLFGVPFPTIL